MSHSAPHRIGPPRCLRALLIALSLSSACDTGDASHGADSGEPTRGVDAGRAPDALRVETRDGPLLGEVVAGARVFRGVPYAAPPLGALRFASPQRHAPWRDPPQPVPTVCAQLGADGVIGGEDCLTLDVWTPLAVPAVPVPVMVWIHGGGFTGGSGYIAQTSLPAHDVVVVAINYRLSAFGFLAHAQLTAEGAGSSGNYAIEDQRVALEWVRDNVAAFGGDPARVTIFGESAGGSAVCAQLWSGQSRGLFQRAIIESGALCGRKSRTLAEGEAQGQRFAEAVACDRATDVVECLRALEPSVLLSALAARTVIADGAVWGPVVDDHVFTRDLPSALTDGDFARVPTLIGTNANEGLAFLFGLESLTEQDYAAQVRGSPFFGEHADELLATYPASAFATPQLAYAALVGDRVFNCPARRTARAIAAAGADAFLYRFSQGLALHAGELAYVFDTGATPSDEVVADAIKRFWTRFAATGDPNGGESPVWPRYELGADEHLVLADPISTGAHLLQRECDVWDQFEP